MGHLAIFQFQLAFTLPQLASQLQQVSEPVFRRTELAMFLSVSNVLLRLSLRLLLPRFLRFGLLPQRLLQTRPLLTRPLQTRHLLQAHLLPLLRPLRHTRLLPLHLQVLLYHLNLHFRLTSQSFTIQPPPLLLHLQSFLLHSHILKTFLKPFECALTLYSLLYLQIDQAKFHHKCCLLDAHHP